MTTNNSPLSGPVDDSAFPTQGRLAGIDYGTVRIGVSICDPGQTFASPHENYNRRTKDRDADYFFRLTQEESIVGFVVGLPLHISGDESEKSREARAFGKWLQSQTQRPVVFHDERYTSSEAEQHLIAANLTKKRRKARLDMLAAQLILKSYLDSRPKEIMIQPADEDSNGEADRNEQSSIDDDSSS